MKAKLVKESLNELNRETYLSAADKLGSRGHHQRSSNMKGYAQRDEMTVNLESGDTALLSSVSISFDTESNYFRGKGAFGKSKVSYSNLIIHLIIDGQKSLHGFFYGIQDFGPGSTYAEEFANRAEFPISPGAHYIDFAKDRKSAKLLYDKAIDAAKTKIQDGVGTEEEDGVDLLEEFIRNVTVNDFYNDYNG